MKTAKKNHILHYSLLGLYILLMFKFKLLDNLKSRHRFLYEKDLHLADPTYPNTLINLIPFRGLGLVTSTLNNVGLFIPLGFLLYMRFRSIKITIITALATSIVIETLQYVFLLGIFDINDIIFNGLGTITGVILCSLFFKFKPQHSPSL